MNKSTEKYINYILRYAATCDGKAYYNPCMYSLGFNNHTVPSEQLNDSLRKFGSICYDDSESNKAWTYFEINEKGRNYIEASRPKGLSGGMIRFASLILTIIQLIPLGAGWTAYALSNLGVIWEPLFILFLIWWPVYIVFKYIWVACDCLKNMMSGRYYSRKDSSEQWERHFPKF